MSSILLREAQLKDPNIGTIHAWLEHCHEPYVKELQLSSPETRALLLLRDQICILDGVMYYDWLYHEGRSRCLDTPQDPPNWVATLTHNLSRVHNLARETIGKTQMRLKRDYDLRVLVHPYETGDVVYLLDSSTKIGLSKKLRPPYYGPLLITCARPPLYVLEDRKRKSLMHHDTLISCHDSTFPLWLRRKRHDLLQTLPIDGVRIMTRVLMSWLLLFFNSRVI